MKKIITIFISLLFLSTIKLANGVAIVNSETPTYLKLISSEVLVNIENQVAIVTSTQKFMNELDDSTAFKYAFPIPEGASATELRWFINGGWEKANISAQPQDTTLPGGSDETTVHASLTEYLGPEPLYFSIKKGVPKDSTITIELKYVQLLQYDFGNVLYSYPNNYTLIQNDPLFELSFEMKLNSGRTIEDLQFMSHSPISLINEGNSAQIFYEANDIFADSDYDILYSLNKDEFGLFGFSTMLADSIVYDKENGAGYFTFVVEPNPQSGSEIIDKVFTLIIDRSGSMSGEKIIQARDAATFIINNLNEGDKFNIVDFSSNVSTLSDQHLEYNTTNKQNALNYITGINSGGGTDIWASLETAVPQFSSATDNTANIIIFFTDGLVSNSDYILTNVNSLMEENNTEIMIFTFGIGNNVNKELLSSLASENNGLSKFLEDGELEEGITQFYLEIQNPVLLGTQLSFSSPGISEIYPNPLPNLYKGQQMIVSGRYSTPVETEIILRGQSSGQPVEYRYNLSLTDTTIPKNQFLTKIWAKQKIEKLVVQYYSHNNSETQIDSLMEEILTLSMAYGIITEFTSFYDDSQLTGVEEVDIIDDDILVDDFRLLGNYPNPFNPSTVIKFSIGVNYSDVVEIKIFNSIGQLVRVLTVDVNGKGMYEITWNGLTNHGDLAPSGMYIYTIDYGNTIIASRMIMIK
jgi:Ca-activated chloride channel homolog